jgi:hypothetical protein
MFVSVGDIVSELWPSTGLLSVKTTRAIIILYNLILTVLDGRCKTKDSELSGSNSRSLHDTDLICCSVLCRESIQVQGSVKHSVLLRNAGTIPVVGITSNNIIIRGATALTNLGRLSSPHWQSFPTAPDGTGLTCGQHIESHSCIFSFPNRTVTSLFE